MNAPFNLIFYEISIWVIPAVIAITFHETLHCYELLDAPLMRHEKWQAHARKEVMSNAAQHLFPKSRMAEGAGDDQIGAECVRFGLQPVGNRAYWNILDPDQISRRAVPPEMLDDVLPWWRVMLLGKAC